MIYIYAGNGNQADQYARFKEIHKQDYRIIFQDGFRTLAGVRNPDVRFVGTWRDRDWQQTDELRHNVAARGGVITEDTSW